MEQRTQIPIGERIKSAIGVQGSAKEAILPMLSYSAINISTAGASYFFSLYYIPFLVYVEGLSSAQVGVIVLLKCIWDAITDPMMGVLTDRTRSRFGKHRVYLLFGAAPFCFAYFMTWYSFGISGSMDSNAVMWYYIAAYLLYSTATTVLAVPHTAMLPELAPEYFLRTQYNSVGYLMNSAGMIPTFLLATVVLNYVKPARFTAGAVLKALLNCFTHSLEPETIPKSNYMGVGLVLALAYAVPILITATKCRERSSLKDRFEPFNGTYVFREYAQVFRNRAFRQYFTITTLYSFALGFYSNAKIFFFKELTDTYFLYGMINVIAGVFEAAGFPLNYAITQRYGKQRCAWITTPFYLISLVIVLFLSTPKTAGAKTVTVVLVIIHTVFYYFGLSGLGFTGTNTYPDVTDVDEMITGRRREGVIATFNTFIKKIAAGVMGMIVLSGLGWFGVQTGDQTAAASRKTAASLLGPFFNQAFGIKFFAAVVPIACVALCLLALKNFSMTKRDHTMIRAAIAVKRKYGAVSLTDEQIAVCEKIAGQTWDSMWLSRRDRETEAPPLETDENGEYTVLKETAEKEENRNENR